MSSLFQSAAKQKKRKSHRFFKMVLVKFQGSFDEDSYRKMKAKDNEANARKRKRQDLTRPQEKLGSLPVLDLGRRFEQLNDANSSKKRRADEDYRHYSVLCDTIVQNDAVVNVPSSTNRANQSICSLHHIGQTSLLTCCYYRHELFWS